MTALPMFPARPDDVPQEVPVAELVTAYLDHVHVLVVQRLRLADPAAVDAVLTHGVAALALLHALVDRLFAARWATVADALAADASRGAAVAAACGLDGSEVAAGLRSWADGQHREGLMTAVERGVVELLARGVGGAR